MTFEETAKLLRENDNKSPVSKRLIICFDPGETTGAAVFYRGLLLCAGQFITSELVISQPQIKWMLNMQCEELMTYWSPGFAEWDRRGLLGDLSVYPPVVIIEDYRVYGWKTDQHSWAHLHTPKLIGLIYGEAVRRLAYFHGMDFDRIKIDILTPMAHEAKQFCTDTKLHDWGYHKGVPRHGRDAVRHGCQYLMFGKYGDSGQN